MDIELYDLSVDERHTLARKARCTPIYLLQIASGIRSPSLSLAERLIKHEPRLTIASLLAPKRRREAKSKKETPSN
jgi:hypothetical protein